MNILLKLIEIFKKSHPLNLLEKIQKLQKLKEYTHQEKERLLKEAVREEATGKMFTIHYSLYLCHVGDSARIEEIGVWNIRNSLPDYWFIITEAFPDEIYSFFYPDNKENKKEIATFPGKAIHRRYRMKIPHFDFDATTYDLEWKNSIKVNEKIIETILEKKIEEIIPTILYSGMVSAEKCCKDLRVILTVWAQFHKNKKPQ